MVTGNLFAGILLAVAVLWYFVRDRRATLLVGLSIPICLTVTLVMLYAFGRTLNVISLAGLAFGVGQALDTAIVMLEAIAQQRERGLARIEATLAGAKQVWPALLASTVTAVIVFLPIVFMRDAVSQLFADLALTISIAVIASLIVAVTALPLAASRWLNAENVHKGSNDRYAAIASWIVRWTDSAKRRYVTVAVLFLAPVVLTWALLPPLDYLPPVKRDAIDGFIQLPPGTNIDTVEREFVQPVAQAPRALHGGREGARAQELLRARRARSAPASACGRSTRTTSTSSASSSTKRSLVGFPDTQSFAAQGNLFGGFGDGRNIDFQLQATDFPALAGRGPLRREAHPGKDARRAGAGLPGPGNGRAGAAPQPRRSPAQRGGLVARRHRHRGAGARRRHVRRRILRRRTPPRHDPARQQVGLAGGAGRDARRDAVRQRACPSANWCRSSPRWALAACGASTAIEPSAST